MNAISQRGVNFTVHFLYYDSRLKLPDHRIIVRNEDAWLLPTLGVRDDDLDEEPAVEVTLPPPPPQGPSSSHDVPPRSSTFMVMGEASYYPSYEEWYQAQQAQFSTFDSHL